jgi:hypothetical protein
VAVLPDGRRALSGSWDNTLRLTARLDRKATTITRRFFVGCSSVFARATATTSTSPQQRRSP